MRIRELAETNAWKCFPRLQRNLNIAENKICKKLKEMSVEISDTNWDYDIICLSTYWRVDINYTYGNVNHSHELYAICYPNTDEILFNFNDEV